MDEEPMSLDIGERKSDPPSRSITNIYIYKNQKIMTG